MKVFLDSDIIISSLISERGAAYDMFSLPHGIELTISDESEKEITDVIIRMDLSLKTYESHRKNKLNIIQTNSEKIDLYNKYTYDIKDMHIVAASHLSKAKFLITYNFKHYNINQIKNDLDIIIYQPGQFMQYLRSIGYKV